MAGMNNNALWIVVGLVALCIVLWFVYNCTVDCGMRREGFSDQMLFDRSSPALSRAGEHRGNIYPVVERPAPVVMVPTGSPLDGVPAPMSIKEEAQPASMEEVEMTEIPRSMEETVLSPPVMQEAQKMTPGKIPIDGPGYRCHRPSQIPPNYYFLDDGAGGEQNQINNICSKSCCNTGNWPVGFDMQDDPWVLANRDKFVGTNQYCQGDYSSGCLCLTKKQARHVLSRGGNGVGLF